jgi:hypothetical protein
MMDETAQEAMRDLERAGVVKDSDPHVSGGAPDDPDTRTTALEPGHSKGSSVQMAIRTTPGQPPDLATRPDILGEFAIAIERSGLAGEKKPAALMYLALTSRLLPWGKPTNRPVSPIGKGTTSSGKSYSLERTLKFFPPEAYLNMGSMSRRYLLYAKENLSHRFIVIPEWASIKDDEEIVAALRTLLSEGRLIHGTVEGDKKRTARRIEREGPTGLLMTTTVANIDEELETRCLAFLTDDSPEQTRRVFSALADLEQGDEEPVAYEPWHELQRWLEERGTRYVVIPYITRLAELMPVVATRLRRDFVSMLCLIRAHALLHQATRTRDSSGRILASITDYAAVRALIGDIVAEGVEAGVSPALRETVTAVSDLLEAEPKDFVSPKKLQDRLQVGRSATYDRIRRALTKGWVVNLAAKDERGLKLALGADLPDVAEGFLPPPEELSGSSPDGHLDDEKGHLPGVLGESSGSPGRPAAPPDRVPHDGFGPFARCSQCGGATYYYDLEGHPKCPRHKDAAKEGRPS